jgi:hypothetical protein
LNERQVVLVLGFGEVLGGLPLDVPSALCGLRIARPARVVFDRGHIAEVIVVIYWVVFFVIEHFHVFVVIESVKEVLAVTPTYKVLVVEHNI